MPAFATDLEALPQGERARYSEIIELIRTAPANNAMAQMNSYYTAYQKISDDPVLKTQFSHRFGVNKSIVPQVGDALMYLSDPREYQAVKEENTRRADEEGFQEREVWNFHWAGIIMVDGPDYITYENLSVENPQTRNTEWFFRMYGPGTQSFHSKMKNDPHATAHGLTATTVGSAPPQRRQVRVLADQ